MALYLTHEAHWKILNTIGSINEILFEVAHLPSVRNSEPEANF